MKLVVKKYGYTGLHVLVSTKTFKEGDTVNVLTDGEIDKIKDSVLPKKLTNEELSKIKSKLLSGTNLRAITAGDISEIKKAVEEIMLPKLAAPEYQSTGAASNTFTASTSWNNQGDLLKAVKAAVREVMDDYTGISPSTKHRF
jgi:hypothetical protein